MGDELVAQSLLWVSGQFDIVAIIGVFELGRDTVSQRSFALDRGLVLGKYRGARLVRSRDSLARGRRHGFQHSVVLSAEHPSSAGTPVRTVADGPEGCSQRDLYLD